MSFVVAVATALMLLTAAAAPSGTYVASLTEPSARRVAGICSYSWMPSGELTLAPIRSGDALSLYQVRSDGSAKRKLLTAMALPGPNWGVDLSASGKYVGFYAERPHTGREHSWPLWYQVVSVESGKLLLQHEIVEVGPDTLHIDGLWSGWSSVSDRVLFTRARRNGADWAMELLIYDAAGDQLAFSDGPLPFGPVGWRTDTDDLIALFNGSLVELDPAKSSANYRMLTAEMAEVIDDVEWYERPPDWLQSGPAIYFKAMLYDLSGKFVEPIASDGEILVATRDVTGSAELLVVVKTLDEERIARRVEIRRGQIGQPLASFATVAKLPAGTESVNIAPDGEHYAFVVTDD